MRREVRHRLRVLSAGLLAVVLLLVIRLYFVQIVHGHDFSLRADRQYLSSSQELYDRGSIYFTRKDGTLLSAATLGTGFIISINPSQITDPEATYAKLNALTPLDHAAFLAASEKKQDPYEVLANRVPDDIGQAISAAKIKGVTVTRERWRLYPAGTKAAQSLGFVAFDNDNSLAGRFGLERYYNDVLDRGAVGLFGNFFAELFANLDNVVVDARASRQGDLITTIDPVVQEKLDQVLAATNATYGSAETGGIIMNPETGEILALNTYPSFDANDFAHGDPAHFGNPLVEHQYEFGSIMKPLTMAAGLDSGVITPTSTYNDTGCVTVNKQTFCNYDLKARGPNTPMQEILSQSLNVGAASIAAKLGHERFRTYFEHLGFGTETGTDLPSEVAGNIQNIKTSPRDIEYDTASFGQGIAETPMQMIKALGALANDGAVVTPHLVRAIRLENGVTKTLSWGKPEKVFSRMAVADTTTMLVKVVDTKLANGKDTIANLSVAAKTGTAQIAGPGGKYAPGLYFHSFMGYFPASDPKYIILLYTKEPKGVQYASETLTEPFMNLTHFLINYYAVPPDRGDKKPTP
jgi:stage V sporulation protein D (sporulation-specific penicillin-binding protein)